MLKEILKKEDCAACRFCCAFRRTSLWETPVFTEENIKAIAEDDVPGNVVSGDCSANPAGLTSEESANPAGSVLKEFEFEGKKYATYDLSDKYKTDSPEEEAPCPYLGAHGCVLNDDEKPWDCKIWPLRVMRKADGELVIALTPTCPSINKLDIETVRSFVQSKLRDDLLAYAAAHPRLIKEYREGFAVLS